MKKLLSLFYKKDGGKFTLYLPYLYWGGAALFAIFVVFQFCLPESDRLAPPEAIATPTLMGEAVSFPKTIESVSETSESTQRRTKSQTKITYSGPQLVLRPRNLSAIQPGAILEAVLVSGASNGVVKAKAKDALVIKGETLIEAGTILIGQGTSTEERLNITFSQAVFRDGTTGQISAQAMDASDKTPGLKGGAWGRKTLSVAGSVGLGFVSGLAQGLQETQGQQGVVIKPPTWKNALLNATSTTALEQSHNLMQGLKDGKPVIQIAAETAFLLIFGGNS